ncbi:MAG: AAA family ATPase [Verrucomicrobia bacterium]|nr:AAA family ATPase [Verrucomicrobiota bacterium]
MPAKTANKWMISEGRLDEFLGHVIAAFDESTAASDVVVIQGLRATRGDPQLGNLNQELAKALNAEVVLVATVFIFPDLNTGNTTYKAVQRSANVLSVGPMLQGLRRPVNDLSRGVLVDDIVYTIALTAIQATQT